MATEHEVALGAGPSNPKRSALIVAVVAIVVIGGGLLVGAGSGEDDNAESRPPVTTAAPESTSSAASSPTTVERTTTTRTEPRFIGTPIPELVGQKVYGIVDGRVVRIDPASGEVTVLGAGSRRAEDWSWLIPRSDGVVLISESATYFADDGSPMVELGQPGGSSWAATDPGRLWVQSYRPRDGGSTAELVDLATGETIDRIEIPQFAYPLGDDGGGGVLVQTDGGGIYAIDTSGAAIRLSDGTFHSASLTHLVLFRCDEHLVCGYEVVNPRRERRCR